ncbi:MAG TPA: response regulator [Thermoanaerobaculia bacterium]|nr:response regulator [Thermoanaerobaculia bacterium]
MALLRRKGRILLLDDDVSMQKLVSMILKREGYRVDAVDSGRKAIEAAEKEDYTALLLDIMMPTEGGMTVLQHLRKNRPELLKRVVLLTGTSDSVLKTISKDVFAVVKKPFQPEELVRTVARIS